VVTLGTALLGRAVDANAVPLDGGPVPRGLRGAIGAPAPAPSQRSPISRPLWTGVRAIDALLTLGRGARVGIFGPPGAGKSSLLETIVRGTRADAVVVALAGERGREAQRWMAACDARTCIVCATGDRPAQERARVAELAFAQAGALAARGLHVLLVLDSLARVAYALRELGVQRGESVGRGGYPPGVVPRLAQLVERAGSFHIGSVTLLATVLHDGDDRDPISEAARSLLDGHITLSERLARAGSYPAIDVLASTSRTMPEVVSAAHLRDAGTVRAALAALAAHEDARALGLEPSTPALLAAIAAEPALHALLRQGPIPAAPGQALEALARTADMLGEDHGYQR
jgi:FliI/YscN family ATPase